MPSIFDWSKTPANNGTADANINWQEGQPPSTVNNSARQMMARVKEYIDDTGAVVTAGTANAITVTLSSNVTAYFEGLRFSFKASNTNTGTATISVNSIGTKNLYSADGRALSAGMIQSGLVYDAVYLTALNSGAGGFQVKGVAPQPVYVTKSSNYTAVDGDHLASIKFTSSAALFFDPVANLRSNYRVEVISDPGVTVRIRPDGSELINGAANLVISDGERATVWCNGTALIANVTSDALTGPQAQGEIYGLTLSNNAIDAVNDIDIAVGFASADVSPYNLMQLSSALGKRLDASWSSGGTPASPNGGLDTGSIADGTYHIWLIQRPDTNNVDALFSLSPTAPTMPSNYTRKRRIGSIIRSAGAIIAFFQDGDRFVLNIPSQDVNATNPGTTAVTRTLSVPVGIQVQAFGYTGIQTQTVSGAFVVYLSDLRQSDQSSSDTVGQMVLRTPGTAGTYQSASYFQVVTNTSAQVRSRINVSNANTTLLISTHGWIDKRGRP